MIRSSIHGYGVVATRSFRAGDTVCFGDGVLYAAEAEFDDTYALVLDAASGVEDEVVYWDLVDQSRWFNHSCEPNTQVESAWDASGKALRAWWVATRDIAPGDEITYDYAFCAEVAEPCACGAPTCRGVIVDDDADELGRLPDKLRRLLRIPARAAS